MIEVQKIKCWGVPLLLVLLSPLSGCKDEGDPAEAADLRSKVSELEAKTQEQAAELQASQQKLEQAKSLASESSSLQEKVDALEAELEEVKAELSEVEKAHKEYVEKYRTSAVGRKLDSLVTLDGKEYTGLTLKEVDDLGVTLLHSAGIVRLEFARLGPEWAEEFGYSEEEAQRQILAEKKATEERLRFHAEQDKLAQEMKERENKMLAAAEEDRQERNRKEEIAFLKLEIEKAKNRISALKREISDRRYRQIVGSQINSASAKIPALQAEVLRLENYIDSAQAKVRYLNSLD